MKSIFQKNLQSALSPKNLEYRKDMLRKQYGQKLSDTITKFLLEVHSLSPEEAEKLKVKYDYEWRQTAKLLNLENGRIIQMKEDAFMNYLEILVKKRDNNV